MRAMTRYTLAFLVPLLATLLLTPLAARLAHRFGVLDHPGGHKTHGEATPYLGGLAVGAGLLMIAAIVGGTSGELLTVLLGALVLGAVGLVDDLRGLSPVVRIVFEVLAALALWTAGIRAGVLHTPWVDLPVTVLWVVAVTNAVNFVDNMDGLAASVAAVSTLGVAAIAASNGDYLVGSFALAVAGACIGFLRYNLPPARIFLGDAGSMLLGFLMAALILKLDLPVGAAAPRALSTVLLAAVPLFDLTLVILARWRGGRRIYQGGTDHLSHRLAAQGVSKRGVVLVVATAQAACCALAYAVYRQPQTVVLGVGAAAALLWVALLVLLLRLPTPTAAGAGDVARSSSSP